MLFAFMLVFALLPAVTLAEEAGNDQQEQTETTTEQEGEDPNGEEGEDPNDEEGDGSGAPFGFLQKLIERTMMRIQMFGEKLENLPEESRPGIERAILNFERQVERFAEMKGWNPGEGKPPWAGNGNGNGEDGDDEGEDNGGPPNGINIGPPDRDKGDWQPGQGRPPWAGGRGAGNNNGNGDDNGDDNEDDNEDDE